ncbi:PP2C family protein-serine/threonine phosphatase [Bacteroidota bacterium]
MADSNPLKRIFDLYTSDLTIDEIEKLVKRESAAAYEFYKNQIPQPDLTKNKFIRSLIFIRSIFNAFLLKLSAARRIFYLVALLIFLIGILNGIDSYIIFSFLIINVLLAFELADKLTMKDELDLARKIQNGLMPQNPPLNEFYEISTYYESAREVGGDYFDFIESSGNSGKSTYIIIGDISGKGMAAALYMVRVQAIIQFLIKHFKGLTEIITNLKNYFIQNLRREYFLTLLIALIKENGDINFCRAGHMPLLHYKQDSQTFDTLNPSGIGIGLNDKGIFEKTLTELEFSPQKDDILLCFTDGVVETMNSNKVQFGEEKLKKLIIDNSDKSVNEIRGIIVSNLIKFRGDVSQQDDSTFILLKCKKS